MATRRRAATNLAWLPIVGAYRTWCIAPPPDVRDVFESLLEF